MAVRLRLMRMGKKKQPTYRIVAADRRSPRDGRFIEIVGTYDPRPDPSLIKITQSKAVKWLRDGAQPSERVRKLLELSGTWDEFKKGTSIDDLEAAEEKASAEAAAVSPLERAAAASAESKTKPKSAPKKKTQAKKDEKPSDSVDSGSAEPEQQAEAEETHAGDVEQEATSDGEPQSGDQKAKE